MILLIIRLKKLKMTRLTLFCFLNLTICATGHYAISTAVCPLELIAKYVVQNNKSKTVIGYYRLYYSSDITKHHYVEYWNARH